MKSFDSDNPKAKTRVAVLFGGRSAEHEVSLQSAANVIKYLDSSRFEVVPIGIDKSGRWFLGQDVFQQSLTHQKVPQLTNAWFTPEWIGTPTRAATQHELIKDDGKPLFDVIFPVVHGQFCEDGCLQGLLELADLPYVGSGVLASAVGMDKDISKRLAKAAGFNIPSYLTVKIDQWVNNEEAISHTINQKLDYPLFVKPANTGSSIGITKVKQGNELKIAMDLAFQFDTKVIIEKALDVVELEVAVLESIENDQHPIVSLVGEIKSRHEFYSYDAKYLDVKGAELLIPAPIPESIKQKAQAAAKQLFLLLECEGMARIDLFLNKHDQQIYFNEINTIPGFTRISMYPKLMEASGVSYPTLLTHLIELAFKRFQQKSKLKRQY